MAERKTNGLDRHQQSFRSAAGTCKGLQYSCRERPRRRAGHGRRVRRQHTGEAAIEAARLARQAKAPVSLRWTRAEEFTWAYFRPAALIEIEAALDNDHRIAAWDFVNYNSGGSG